MTLTRNITPFAAELRKACECDLFGLTLAKIYEKVDSGEWLAADIGGQAVGILEIRELTSGPALSVVALGGKAMPRWIGAFVAFLAQLAADQGCTSIMAIGRPGWTRYLRNHGFQWRATLVTRSVP